MPKGSKVIKLFLFFLVFASLAPFACAERLIIVEKVSRTLYLYQDGEILKAFPVSLGFNPVSPKTRRGDGATPEGLYYVNDKHPSKKYNLFVGISYPNLKDIESARWRGELSPTEYEVCLAELKKGGWSCPLGNSVGIHGGGVFRKGKYGLERDWTHGCIALDDEDMKEVYRFARIGTPVLIYSAQRPLFDILKHLVPQIPCGTPGTTWHGNWEFVSAGTLLRVSLSEDPSGRRQLTIVGYQPDSEHLLFWFNDRNGDGVLEPWEPKTCLDRCQSYSEIKRLILETLPFWIQSQTSLLGRGG